MLDIKTIILFCITSLVLIITPGPNMLYIIARSIGQGRKEGIISALGVDTGSLAHISAAAIGLSALIVSSSIAFHVVRYLGAGYLIYLGVRIMLKQPELKQNEVLERKNLRQLYFQGILTNVLNPKVAVFFLALFPQFVDTSRGSVAGQILLLGSIFILIGLTVDIIIALVAGTTGNWLKSTTQIWKLQKWISGSVLITLGVSTALTGSDKR